MPQHMQMEHIWHFWAIVTGIFGALQLLVILVRDSEHTRAILAWVTGTYWIWSGTSQLSTHGAQFYDGILIIIGISCMYTFIINLLITSEKDQYHGNDAIT